MRRMCRTVVALLLLAGYLAGTVHPRPATSTAAGRAPDLALAAAGQATRLTGTPLLLVHGWSDSCRAFNSVDLLDQLIGAQGESTVSYLTSHGVPRNLIRMVGYYRSSWSATWQGRPNFQNDYSDYASDNGYPTSDTSHGDCDVNVYDDPKFNYPGQGGGTCSGFNSPNSDYYTNDSLLYLSCIFAWYVYNTYTSVGQAVNILAHSMGGLVVRGAMAFSGAGQAAYKPGFPTAPLAVNRIVTVATPHGGLDGITAALYNSGYPGTQVTDMTVCPNLAATCFAAFELYDQPLWVSDLMHTSQFMRDLINAGTPRGADGALWMLMASGTPSVIDDADLPSYAYTHTYQTQHQFTSTDWVVPTESQLDLAADVKIVYGSLEDHENGEMPSGGPVYDHEANTCVSLTSGFGGWLVTAVTGVSAQPCAPGPFYLNDDGSDMVPAWICVGNCANQHNGLADVGIDETNANGHYGAKSEPRSLAEITHLLLDPPVSQVAHAAHAGDDYPYAGVGMYNRHEGVDPWTQYYGQCDGFASWKVYENLGGTQVPAHDTVPAVGWTPTDASLSPVVGYAGKSSSTGTWGDATDWINDAHTYGVPEDNVPQPGSIAVWTAADTGWHFGHVGYVTDVYADGSINVESYNFRDRGLWSNIRIWPAQGAYDTSYYLSAAYVPWPSGFVHLGDGGGTLPPQSTAPAHWPANTIGPNIGTGFTVAGQGTNGGWTEKAPVGEIGSMDYTYTHAGAVDSRATYSPALTPYACYRVDVFVPDNDSNAIAALYQVSDQHFGTSYVPVNENNFTNQFAPLGVFQARPDGTLPVTLQDNGVANQLAGADGMRFVFDGTCADAYRAALVLDPSMPAVTLAGTGTNHGWTALSGHGLLGNDLWAHTHAGNPNSTVTYAATGLSTSTCYAVSAFVPDNDANSPTALYKVNGQLGSVNENNYTNQWAPVGQFTTDGSGNLSVQLSDSSPTGYVGADAVAFAPGPCSPGMNAPIIDPGTAGFSLTGTWNSAAGHGLRGQMRWHASGGAQASAAYQPVLFPGCYNAEAFVPDADATELNTVYSILTVTGASQSGISGTFDEYHPTNQWVALGRVDISAGTVATVTIFNNGPNGATIGADAVAFAPTSCATVDPSAYPWPSQDGWVGDGHGYYEGECVSFAAWALRSDGLPHAKSPDFQGNADKWTGASVDATPQVGDIAQWDDSHNGAGSLGHVAYVANVNLDGTITVYEYNWGTFHRMDIRTISASAPSRYLHY